jgi:hypothetical protein
MEVFAMMAGRMGTMQRFGGAMPRNEVQVNAREAAVPKVKSQSMAMGSTGKQPDAYVGVLHVVGA